MPQNLGFDFSIKNNNDNYITLYPQTNKFQILGWDIGEIFGPYEIILSKDNWNNLQQIINLEGINSNNTPFCINILSGGHNQMLQQQKNYNLLHPYLGIESLNNQIKFKCLNQAPQIDLSVQIFWTI